MRDHPMAQPMRAKYSLSHSELDITSFSPNQPSQSQNDRITELKQPSQSQNDPITDMNESDPIDGWFPTPPFQLGDDDDEEDMSDDWVLHPDLRSSQVSPSDESLEEISLAAPRKRSITPAGSQPASKKHRSLGKSDLKTPSHPFDSPDSSGPRDGLGLKSLISQMPTKEERAESQHQFVTAQEQITDKMTNVMTNMITSNQAIGIQYKTRVARGSMIVDVIRAGRTPEEAQSIAREEFPDN